MSISLKNKIQALRFNWPIVDPRTGNPTQQFGKLFQLLLDNEDGLAESTPANLDDLDDVSAGSPSAGDVLSYDGTNWTPSAGGGMSHQQVMARASIGV